MVEKSNGSANLIDKWLIISGVAIIAIAAALRIWPMGITGFLIALAAFIRLSRARA